jgi:hypothetical protein
VETLDLDEPGPDPPPVPPPRGDRRRRRRWWVASAVVLLVVLTLFGVDQRSRYRENDALIDQVSGTQSALAYADGRIGSAVQYTRPALTSAAVPESVRAGLRAIVQKEAAARVAPLLTRRQALADVPVRSWHHDQVRAKTAYAAYLDARIAAYRAISVDLRVLFRPGTESTRRRVTARRALLDLDLAPKQAAEVERLLDTAP